MDQNENTNSGPGQNQSSPELQESEQPKAETDNLPEPSRKCEICGSPNHHACGCEARAKIKAGLNDLPRVHYLIDAQALCRSAEQHKKGTENQYEVTCPECFGLMKTKTNREVIDAMREKVRLSVAEPEQPLSEQIDEVLDDVLSVPAIKEMHDRQLESFANIDRMSNGIEGICTQMYDLGNYLKLITGDLITIRKALVKEAEVKNVDGNQN